MFVRRPIGTKSIRISKERADGQRRRKTPKGRGGRVVAAVNGREGRRGEDRGAWANAA